VPLPVKKRASSDILMKEEWRAEATGSQKVTPTVTLVIVMCSKRKRAEAESALYARDLDADDTCADHPDCSKGRGRRTR
jgi:hypothetical protein